MTSLVAQVVMNLPAMQETRVWSLSQEDSLEKRMAIYSSIFAWRIPWTEEPGGPQCVGSQRVRHNWATELDWTELGLFFLILESTVKNTGNHWAWLWNPVSSSKECKKLKRPSVCSPGEKYWSNVFKHTYSFNKYLLGVYYVPGSSL